MQVGAAFLEGMGDNPGGFGGSGFTANLVQSVMEDHDFKIEMFRFVDVLPVLPDADEVARHIDEYFNRQDGPAMPGWMRAGARIAGSGFAKGIIANQIERNVVGMAKQFIAGETGAEALPRLRKMRAKGLSSTVDLLGEKTLGYAEAETYKDRYLEVLESLASDADSWAEGCHEEASWGAVPRVNLSIKLSALDPHFNPLDRAGLLKQGRKLLGPIARRAQELGAFINVDMEDDNAREATYWLFEQLAETEDLRNWDGLGVVVQAYLNDSLDDLKRLRALAERRDADHRAPRQGRLLGKIIQAQQEGWPVPVYLNKADTDANTSGWRAICSIISSGCAWCQPQCALDCGRHRRGRGAADPGWRLEFQMLYGMAEGLMETVSNLGYRLRSTRRSVRCSRAWRTSCVASWRTRATKAGWSSWGRPEPCSIAADRSSMAVMPPRASAPAQARSGGGTPFASEPCSTRTASQARRAGTQPSSAQGRLPLKVSPCLSGQLNPAKRKGGPKNRTKATNCSPRLRAPASGRRNAMEGPQRAFRVWADEPVSIRAARVQLAHSAGSATKRRR